jgi:hypothetical protein
MPFERKWRGGYQKMKEQKKKKLSYTNTFNTAYKKLRSPVYIEDKIYKQIRI